MLSSMKKLYCISIKCLKLCNQKIPEMLKVKEGFHQDLSANAIDELRGPILPWKKDINYLMLQYIATSTNFLMISYLQQEVLVGLP